MVGFKFRKTIITYVILTLLLTACHEVHINYSNKHDLFEVTTIELPEDYLGGNINRVHDNDGNLIISDFSARALFSYKPDANSLTQLGERGPGPGEYEFPYHIAFTDKGLFFSEATSLKIKRINLQGDLIDEYIHSRGGARFDIKDSLIYIQSSMGVEDQIDILNIDGDKVGGALPIDIEKKQVISRIKGGGVTVYGEEICTINSLIPMIYCVAADDPEKERVIPLEGFLFNEDFESIQDSFDKSSRFGDFVSVITSRAAIFYGIDSFHLRGVEMLIIPYRFRGRDYLLIIDPDKNTREVLRLAENERYVGTSTDNIFTSQLEEKSNYDYNVHVKRLSALE